MDHGAAAEDRRWMAAALALATRAVGRVAPNPAVAALIVRDGLLLARGVTAPGGRPHAEAVALADAAARGVTVDGATAYVTLEPCAHHGLTPPCADALATAGISRVVCPLEDPDPRVSGRGFETLERLGIRVTLGVGAEAAEDINAGFLSRIRRGRPFVTLKLATTLDGRIATASGESRWITGPAARRRVHLMRLRSDAVMVGAGTARDDDPMLDVRGFGESAAQPSRVVADPRLTLDPMGRLASTASRHPVMLLHRNDLFDRDPSSDARAAALTAKGVMLIACPVSSVGSPSSEGDPQAAMVSRTSAGIDLPSAMGRLAERGIGSVLVEGGGTLAASLMVEGLVDRLVVFGAGAVIGGDGRPAVGAMGLQRLSSAPRFQRTALAVEGDDVMSTWEPVA
ncbi:MAG: bifunctional diaminohydroxyphosphoribosylaminopyrimidine deaminase/5-amino-6-(5-phosphoribosylamino)uracil reductase RibD [Pseudomonadota bacterium]